MMTARAASAANSSISRTSAKALHELLERHGLGIAAMTLQLLAKRIEGLERRLRGEGEPLMQPGKMEVGAVVEDGGKSGEPDRTAEIAGEIE
jgi:hypothetical protein